MKSGEIFETPCPQNMQIVDAVWIFCLATWLWWHVVTLGETVRFNVWTFKVNLNVPCANETKYLPPIYWLYIDCIASDDMYDVTEKDPLMMYYCLIENNILCIVDGIMCDNWQLHITM